MGGVENEDKACCGSQTKGWRFNLPAPHHNLKTADKGFFSYSFVHCREVVISVAFLHVFDYSLPLSLGRSIHQRKYRFELFNLMSLQ